MIKKGGIMRRVISVLLLVVITISTLCFATAVDDVILDAYDSTTESFNIQYGLTEYNKTRWDILYMNGDVLVYDIATATATIAEGIYFDGIVRYKEDN